MTLTAMPKPVGVLALAAYIATIPLANWMVDRYGIVPVGFGLMAPAAVYVVGLAFTLRDLVHDAYGRVVVLTAILAGGGLSALVAPRFALASAVAFLVSELADLAVYSPLRQRNWLCAVALSNVVGLVLDSLLFLWLAFGGFAFLPGQVLGKAWMTLAAVLILLTIRQAALRGGAVRFLLGTHETSWLGHAEVPLFISRRRFQLARRRPQGDYLPGAPDLTPRPWRKRLPVAAGPWALDSGGFTELNAYGRWVTPVDQYVHEVRRAMVEIGRLEWAAPMDWMCEPVVTAKTGLTVADHQTRTVGNYLDLRATAPDLPFIPVLQGWTLDDYLRCVDLYDQAGVDLTTLPLVGIGSVCRRQNTGEIDHIISTIADLGISLHGFGVKTTGLAKYAEALTSADSMAWSYRARNAPPLAGCSHKSCANCPRFALRWREKVIRCLGAQRLPFGGEAA